MDFRKYFFYLLKLLILFAVYFITARMGLAFDAVSGFATLVWPPTGIALAALLLFGVGLWPAVFLAAFAVNWMTGAPVSVALGIATGNTLEAVTALYLLSSVGFRKSLDRLQDALELILFGAFLSTIISATAGTMSLLFGGIIDLSAFGATWSSWWVGDILGNLVIAPLLLIWLGKKPSFKLRTIEVIEIGTLLLTIIIVSFLVFGEIFPTTEAYPLGYLIFFPIMWAAIRFNHRGSTLTTFAIATIAVFSTSLGLGPFVREGLSESLFYMQIFIGVLAATTLILAAVIAERREKEILLRIANEDLEKRVEERTVDLSKSEAKLAEYAKGLEKMVTERTKELEEKVTDMEKLNKFMVGRELKMIGLKEDISRLQVMLENKPKPISKLKINNKNPKGK